MDNLLFYLTIPRTKVSLDTVFMTAVMTGWLERAKSAKVLTHLQIKQQYNQVPRRMPRGVSSSTCLLLNDQGYMIKASKALQATNHVAL